MTAHPIPDAALETDIAILGRKGRGKTFAAKGVVERLLDMERRVVILDPLSTWWGLRSAANGKAPGYPVAVFGGPHGDMPLTVAMAEPLAEVIARENLPCVIDYGDLSRADIQRFAHAFLEKLYRLNREPLTLVLEEADVLAPQNPMGDQALVLSSVDKIARRGRNFGFRLITMTQRPARLHKDVLSQAATLVALGVTSPQDRDALKAWVEGNGDRDQARAVFESLAKLDVGEGWVWASESGSLKRVRFPKITTLDTSATPKAGEKRIEPKSLAQVDLTEIRAALEAPEPAPVKSRGVDAAALQAAREAAFADGHKEGYRKGYQSGIADSLGRAIEALVTMKNATPAEPEEHRTPAPPRAKAALAVRDQTAPDASKGFSKAQIKVLEALSFWRALGFNEPTRAQVAAVAGYSLTSGGFGAVIAQLRASECLDFPRGNALSLTQAGLIQAPPSRGGGVRDRMGAVLSGPQARILDALLHGRAMSREELAAATNYSPTSGGFGALLSSLKTLCVIDYPTPGEVQLEGWMLEGV